MTDSKKTDTHDPRAKLDLRRHFLEKYHADGTARVLDCCMGSGFIWREIRKEWPVAEYLGLDAKPKKGRLKIDSARYLEAGGWSHDVIDVERHDV
jgi:ubiquinone/menaquinone biosynthesis C-methylase UbiE